MLGLCCWGELGRRRQEKEDSHRKDSEHGGGRAGKLALQIAVLRSHRGGNITRRQEGINMSMQKKHEHDMDPVRWHHRPVRCVLKTLVSEAGRHQS